MPSVFYTFDERGNLAQRLDASGAVLSTDLYDAFGARTGTAAPSDPWGFGAQWGYQSDAETGLVLCTNRYYDPQQGRFLTRDPLGYDGGVNLYSYTANNPVNDIDPYGTQLAPVVEQDGPAAWAAIIAAAAVLAKWGHDHPLPPINLPPIHFNPPWSHPTSSFPGEIPHPAPPNYVIGDRGGKSREEYEKHLKGLADALAREKELIGKLAKTRGAKERGSIENALDKLRNGKNGIRGHQKEIGQKWPNGCPAE